MASGRVQIKYAQCAGSGASSLTATLDSNTTAGNLLVLCYAVDNSVPTWAFTGGSPTTSSATEVTSPIWMGMRYIANVASGISAVTMNFSFGPACLAVVEYSGIATSSPLDQVHSNDNGFGSSNPQTSGTTSTLAATDDLAVGFLTQWRSVASVTMTATGSWTIYGTQIGSTSAGEPSVCVEDILGTGSTTGVAATANASSTSSTQVEAFVATFKAAAGGGGAPPRPLIKSQAVNRAATY